MINVLITSAGRRTSLTKAFKKAVKSQGGQLVAVDADVYAPALCFADRAFKAPRINSLSYGPFIEKLIYDYEIKTIVPTIDTELMTLSMLASDFSEHGCRPLISASRLIEICGDKWLTAKVFEGRDIAVPSSWLPGDALQALEELPEELFVKPRAGSASMDTYKVGKKDLLSVLHRVPDPIIQEAIIGPEITIDALIDFSGTPIHYVPRKRVRTIGGESVQGITIADTEIREWICKVLEIIADLGGIGPMTLQAFMTEKGPILSEVNPRFGGGFPLAKAAGGNYPEWIVRMLAGEKINPRIGLYEEGLSMTRYYKEIFTREPLCL